MNDSATVHKIVRRHLVCNGNLSINLSRGPARPSDEGLTVECGGKPSSGSALRPTDGPSRISWQARDKVELTEL